jgi:hypothetical protein
MPSFSRRMPIAIKRRNDAVEYRIHLPDVKCFVYDFAPLWWRCVDDFAVRPMGLSCHTTRVAGDLSSTGIEWQRFADH